MIEHYTEDGVKKDLPAMHREILNYLDQRIAAEDPRRFGKTLRRETLGLWRISYRTEIGDDKWRGQNMSSQILTPNTESAMLARILQADARELTLDAARYWLSVKLPVSDQDRVDELSAKARAGSLTEAETQELDNYLHIGFLLGTMQAKARRMLPMDSAVISQ